MPYPVRRCSEFPNDNPSLHEGAIWLCAEIGAEASCELPRADETRDPGKTTFVAIEIADAEVDETAAELEEEIGTTEVVDDLTFEEHAVAESPSSESPRRAAIDPLDAFEAFASVLEEVATARGADARAIVCLRALLGQSRLDGIAPDDSTVEALVAGAVVVRADRGLVRAPGFTNLVLAWQGILRGESEDFGPCGSATLDEWSASLVARVLGLASRTEEIRRELRRRGVAAFGFIADAA